MMRFVQKGQERGEGTHGCLMHWDSSQLQNTEGGKVVECLIMGARSLGALRIAIYCGQPSQQVQHFVSYWEDPPGGDALHRSSLFSNLLRK